MGLQRFCIYEVLCTVGTCSIEVGDLVCVPCVQPCPPLKACRNSEGCVILLELQSENCSICPFDSVILPDEFECFD
jgi:hypothetical protein